MIPKRHLAIWRADANGQLGPSEKTKQTAQKNTIIGPYVNTHKLEPGNGNAPAKTCVQRNMIPTITWKRAPLTKTENEQIKNSGNSAGK